MEDIFCASAERSTQDFHGVGSWSDDTSVGYVVGNSSGNWLSFNSDDSSLLRAATAIMFSQEKQCLAPLADTTALLEAPDPEWVRSLFQEAPWETFAHRCQQAGSYQEMFEPVLLERSCWSQYGSKKYMLVSFIEEDFLYIWRLASFTVGPYYLGLYFKSLKTPLVYSCSLL